MFNDVKNYRCEIKHSTIYPEKKKKKRKEKEEKTKKEKEGRKEEKRGKEKETFLFVRINVL